MGTVCRQLKISRGECCSAARQGLDWLSVQGLGLLSEAYQVDTVQIAALTNELILPSKATNQCTVATRVSSSANLSVG